MTSNLIYIVVLTVIMNYSIQIEIKPKFPFIIQESDEYINGTSLREWINKFVIDIPNDLIKEQTDRLENLTIYEISLDRIITTNPEKLKTKVGLNISISNAGINIKGIYNGAISGKKNFIAHISNLNVLFPFYLISDKETGLVSEVDASGLNIDIQNAKIDIDIDIAFKNILVGLLKIVLNIIKSNVIEKNLVQTINTKLGGLFQKVNNIILNGVEPKKLNISINETDLSNLKQSPIISSVDFLLNNLTGVNGPLNLNHLVNLFTFYTGRINLRDFYNKSIHFEFNLTSQDNSSLGQFDVGIEDLNISGLNTWQNFTALEPYDELLLNSYTNLQNLTINVTFTMKIKLDNTSKLVKEESILFEKANFRTNLHDNKLKALLQLPINKTKFNEYSSKECLNLVCISDLPDSNGTGITALSLNEIFSYILLEVDRSYGGLEEDVDDTIDKLISLFIGSFEDKIGLLINAVLNTTVIDLANEQINNYLYASSCPGIPDVYESEINVVMTSLGGFMAIGIFILLILHPYILGKACGKNNNSMKTDSLLDDEKVKEKESNNIEIKNVNNDDMEAKYCLPNISIKWIKEFGRTDPEGASLFLDPRIPVFWRILIPFSILVGIALFISSNSGNGASVYIVFSLGKRIQLPSLFDFGLINSIREMCKAGVYFLAAIVAIFSGFWPYCKLILMLISFALPASILSKRKREIILMGLDATGKWSILDSYVLILMLVAFHFHIQFPVTEQSEVEKGSVIDVFVYAAYGFLTLILGTIISLCLSHIITHLNRSLDEHPDQNKGEKAESYTALISFADSKLFGQKFLRIIISFLLFATLILVIIGSTITSFSFYFHGLAGYALDLFEIAPHREYSVITLGTSVPESYEDPNDRIIRFTQVIYFLTVFVLPIATILNIMFLWFVPLPRRIQKFLYSMAEILNAWSCLDVFVLSIIAAILQISQFTEFIVGDKCDAINPIVEKYFSDILGGHNTCFEVKAYLESGCWMLFAATIIFYVVTYAVLKICRNALDERLPDNVKEYLKNKKNHGSARETLVSLNNKEINNINNTISTNNNNDSLEEDD